MWNKVNIFVVILNVTLKIYQFFGNPTATVNSIHQNNGKISQK